MPSPNFPASSLKSKLPYDVLLTMEKSITLSYDCYGFAYGITVSKTVSLDDSLSALSVEILIPAKYVFVSRKVANST